MVITPSSATSSQAVKLEKIDGPTWDRIAIGFRDLMQEQTYCYNASRWGAHRIECFTLTQDDTVVAGAVVILFYPPFLKNGLAIVKWGPVWRLAEKPDNSGLLSAALSALKSEFVRRRRCFLTIVPPADPGYEKDWIDTFMALGFKSARNVPFPDRYFVNVSKPITEQHKGLHHKWRYNLKKAEKHDLDIKFANTRDGFEEFMMLYRQMLDRKKFSDYSMISTLPEILVTDVEPLKPKIILAYHKDKPTAGAVIDDHGDRAIYLYGATDDRALPLKAGYAMHWWIAQWLTDKTSARWYDLGGTDGFQGLHQFKKGFVGQAGQIVPLPAQYNCCESVLGLFVGESMYALKSMKTALFRVRDYVAERFS